MGKRLTEKDIGEQLGREEIRKKLNHEGHKVHEGKITTEEIRDEEYVITSHTAPVASL